MAAISEKSSKEQNSTNLLHTMTPNLPWGINVQSPQSESTPRRLNLGETFAHFFKIFVNLVVWLASLLSLDGHASKSNSLSIICLWNKEPLLVLNKEPSLYYLWVFSGFFEPPTHLRKDIFTTYSSDLMSNHRHRA